VRPAGNSPQSHNTIRALAASAPEGQRPALQDRTDADLYRGRPTTAKTRGSATAGAGAPRGASSKPPTALAPSESGTVEI
jgi:hypothetical protein